MQMGLASNETIKTKCDYWSVLGWYLDCWTGLLKNILIYLDLVRHLPCRMKRKDANKKSHSPSTPSGPFSICPWPIPS